MAYLFRQLLAAVALALLVPGLATASTVARDGDALTWSDGGAETGDMYVEADEGGVVFQDFSENAIDTAVPECSGGGTARVVCATAGAGSIVVNAGGGDDVVHIGSNSLPPLPVTVNAGDGSDTVDGSALRDRIDGDAGNDFLEGDAGVDTVDGGDGDDSVTGNDADDLLFGGAGNDSLHGLDGDDVMDGGPGADETRGYEGFDTVSYASAPGGVTVTADGTANDPEGDNVNPSKDVERIVGSPFRDLMNASASPGVVLEGGDGNDLLTGGILRGEGGHDQLTGTTGADDIRGGDGLDDLRGGYGNDTLMGGEGADSLWGEQGDDVERGEGGDDWIGSDLHPEHTTYVGTPGRDPGNNTLDGGDGNDQLYQAPVGTSTTYAGGAGHDEIHLLYEYGHRVRLDGVANDGLLGGGQENVQPDIEEVWGGGGSDLLYAGGRGATLHGGNGADSLNGGPGADTLEGGYGGDSFYCGLGQDVVRDARSGEDLVGQDCGDEELAGIAPSSLIRNLGTLPVKDAAVTTSVLCPTTADGGCSITVALSTIRLTATAARVLGRASHRAGAGKRIKLKVKLSRAARRRLAAKGKLKVYEVVTFKVNGTRALAVKRVTLKRR